MSTEQKTQDMVIRQFNAQIGEQMYGPDSKKVKKRASKVAHNWPRPFYFTVQPRPQPTAQN